MRASRGRGISPTGSQPGWMRWLKGIECSACRPRRRSRPAPASRPGVRRRAAAGQRRVIHACESPNVNIVGYPRTRLIGRRPPIDADWDAVFAARVRTGTAQEIDASLIASAFPRA
jgi:hypothetical protein